MDLEEIFLKETGVNAYTENNLAPKIYCDYYIEWLEAKINYTRCS